MADRDGEIPEEAMTASDALRRAVAPQGREHWLLLGKLPNGTGNFKHGTVGIVGCYCGFSADLNADDGYGDSVVAHITAEALRAGLPVVLEALAEQMDARAAELDSDDGDWEKVIGSGYMLAAAERVRQFATEVRDAD